MDELKRATIKSKTFWTGVGAIAAAGAGYATGEFSSAEAVRIGIDGALGVFIRMALPKVMARVAGQQEAP